MTASSAVEVQPFAVEFRDMMLSILRKELPATTRVVEAIPEASMDYRPAPKSKSARELAWHLLMGTIEMLEGVADMKFVMKGDVPAPGKAEMLRVWTTRFPEMIERIEGMTAEELRTPVDFYGAFTQPVYTYLPIISNHLIHHRGQLTAYLRPMGGKVPSIYGGSADEPWEA